MKPFTENLRYEYPIAPESVCLDVGAHEGNWSYEIWRRYGCHVIAFEPIREYWWKSIARLSGTNAAVLPLALGGRNRKETFMVHGAMSGPFADGHSEEVEIVSVAHIMAKMHIGSVGLIKLNCEGSEFEILEHIIAANLQTAFCNIQVQFHQCAPDASARYLKIREALEKTHHLTYHQAWCWENYELNT